MTCARGLRSLVLRLWLCLLCFSTQSGSMPCDMEHLNHRILYDNFDARNPCEGYRDVSSYPGYGQEEEDDLSTFLDDAFFGPVPFGFPTPTELDRMFGDSDELYADLAWGETSRLPRPRPMPDTHTQTFGFQGRSDPSPGVKLTPTNNCEDTSSLETLNEPAFTSLDKFFENAFEILRQSSERARNTREPMPTTTDRPYTRRVDRKITPKPRNKFQGRYFQDFKDASLPSDHRDMEQDVGETGRHFDRSSVGDEASEERSHRLPTQEETDASADDLMTSGDHSPVEGHDPMRTGSASKERDVGEPGTNLWLGDMPEHGAYFVARGDWDLSASALTLPEDIPAPSVTSPSALPSPEDTLGAPIPPPSASSSSTPVSPITVLSGTASSAIDSSEMLQNDMFGALPCVQGFSLDHRGKCRLMIQPISAVGPRYSHSSSRPWRRRLQ